MRIAYERLYWLVGHTDGYLEVPVHMTCWPIRPWVCDVHLVLYLLYDITPSPGQFPSYSTTKNKKLMRYQGCLPSQRTDNEYGRGPTSLALLLDLDLTVPHFASSEARSVHQNHDFPGFRLLTDRYRHKQRTFVHPSFHLACYLS